MLLSWNLALRLPLLVLSGLLALCRLLSPLLRSTVRGALSLGLLALLLLGWKRLSPLLWCGLLLLLWPLSPLLRSRLRRGGLGRLRLRPLLLLLRALPRLRLSSWCLGRLSLGSLHRRSRCGWRLSRLRRSSWCRSNGRRGRGRCSRLLFHVRLCLCGFSCRLYRRCRLVRCLSFRLRNRRMAGGRRL